MVLTILSRSQAILEERHHPLILKWCGTYQVKLLVLDGAENDLFRCFINFDNMKWLG